MFEASLCYIERSCLKTKQNTTKDAQKQPFVFDAVRVGWASEVKMYSFRGGCCSSGEFCYILNELFDLRSMCAECDIMTQTGMTAKCLEVEVMALVNLIGFCPFYIRKR